MKNFILFILLFFCTTLVESQNKNSKKKVNSKPSEKKAFKGMQAMPSGYYFVSHRKSKSKRETQIGDVVFLTQTIFTDDDSLIFDSNSMLQDGEISALKIAEPSYKGDMYEILKGLRSGDSVSFALRIDSMFEKYYRQPVPEFFQKNEYFIYHVRIDSLIDKEIVSKKESEQMEIERQMNALYQMIEDSTLAAYLIQNNITESPTESGLYFLEKVKGSGMSVDVGDSVSVVYQGMFLDGTIFDSSLEKNETFSFVAGIGEVIPGWDESVLKMNQGSSATVILPSNLAYGPNGIDNAIPPYSTLLFRIDLVRVKKNK